MSVATLSDCCMSFLERAPLHLRHTDSFMVKMPNLLERHGTYSPIMNWFCHLEVKH